MSGVWGQIVIDVRPTKAGRVTGWTLSCGVCRFRQVLRTRQQAVAVAQEHDKVVHKGEVTIRIAR